MYPYIGACRAYFQLLGDLTIGESTSGSSIKAFNLNFGDSEETTSVNDEELRMNEGISNTTTWYDLSGRRLTVKPTKGLYIVNGKKVMIK